MLELPRWRQSHKSCLGFLKQNHFLDSMTDNYLKNLFLSCFELFLGLLPHMQEIDLTVLKYRKIPKNLVFKDNQNPLYGLPAVFSTAHITAQCFMALFLFRLSLTVQTTQTVLQ